MRRLILFVSMTLAAVLAGPVPSGVADTAPAVTLSASPTSVTFGQTVGLTGQVTPPSGGQTIDVLDAHGGLLAQATTEADGSYSTSAEPDRNMSIHAQWGPAVSGPVDLRVRPFLTAKRSDVRLFDTTVVTGRLAPALGGSHVDVTLWTNGSPVVRARPMVLRNGTFRAELEVDGFGTHSVVVRFHDGEHQPVMWRSHPARTSLPPPLHEGSRGPFVQLLERRLAELGYQVYAQDPVFDYRDADTVMAFHKVQGMARTHVVDGATWRALAHPKSFKIVGPATGTHWEVDLTKQVVAYVVRGRAAAIFHVSSGKPSTPTRPGTFHVWSKQPGTNSKGMYFSSFFDGNRAFHGYPDVPEYAASHGCVRMPFWNALWVYDHAPIGMLVIVHY
ncbi:MAG: L,D-transpeptidase family protein [Actinomycetota bacterium]